MHTNFSGCIEFSIRNCSLNLLFLFVCKKFSCIHMIKLKPPRPPKLFSIVQSLGVGDSEGGLVPVLRKASADEAVINYYLLFFSFSHTSDIGSGFSSRLRFEVCFRSKSKHSCPNFSWEFKNIDIVFFCSIVKTSAFCCDTIFHAFILCLKIAESTCCLQLWIVLRNSHQAT